ncbi:MAG: HD domain-containing phosphohydrolase [Ignavibacteriales bacterium]
MANENFILDKEDYLILIVDDQEEVLESAKMLLELEDYVVLCAQNGAEAIEIIKEKNIDLMLLDYFMPGMTGEDVVKKVREFNKDIVIILQTGYAGEKPPLEMLRLLNIQGYHDKTEGPDKLLLWVASGIRSCSQIRLNKDLNDEIVVSNQRLKDSYYKLKRNNYELIEAFTKAVDAKDAYTAGHSTRVSIFARIIGRQLNMKNTELNRVKVGALFHDIGKIGIPDGVLLKEGRLTDEEFTVIKRHPEIGSGILMPVTMLADIIPAVKHHHEKYNGMGYPSGLSGENIPLHARILAIADSFDAMTSNRSYQKKRTFEEALEELERCAGTHFDPELTNIFVGQFRKNMKFYTRLITFWDKIHKFDKAKEYKDSYSMVSEG